MLLRVSVTLGCAAALIGCASGKSSTTDASSAPTTASASTSSSASGKVVRWTGNLAPTTQRTGQMAPSGQARAFGTVTLTAAEGSPNRTRARLTVDAPVQNASLPWALFPGRCGSGTLPIAGFELFPQIDIGNTGRGQLDVELAISLPKSGSYHVNVFWQGQTLDQVMTCANLKAS